MSLPRPPADRLPLPDQAELDRSVEAFQQALHAGRRPSLEAFLPQGPGSAVVLTELVHVELEFRLKHGEATGTDEYLARYPQLAEDPVVVADLVAAEQAFRRRQLPQAGPSDDVGDGGLSTPVLSPAPPGRLDAVSLPTVPGYQILAPLGTGGMGIVYEARQLGLNRTVALKMLHAGTLSDSEHRVRFRTEVEAITRLQHANIVQVHEFGEHEGRLFFSMEFLGGSSLADQLRGAPQPPAVAAAAVEVLARAMHFAHSRGVVHRDLKPANVLRSADGTLKITDFGLARLGPSDLTVTGALLGTPSYMAPEQAAGKIREVGPAADVYALGAILYELLTGRPPFRGATASDTLQQVQYLDPVPPRRLQPKVPRDLETICLKCLEKDPRRRYASALDLADDLGRFLRGEPVHARPPSTRERAVRWARRYPTALVLLTASMAAVLGLVLHFFQLRQAFDLVKEERDSAQKSEAEARDRHYAADVGLADERFRRGDVFQLPALLDRHLPAPAAATDRRDFAWWYLRPHAQEMRLTLAAYDGPVHLLAYTADSQCLVTAGTRHGGQVLEVYDMLTRRYRFSQKHANPDGRTDLLSAYAPNRRLLAGISNSSTVTLWDATSTRPRLQLPTSPEGVICVALSPDGRFVAAGGPGPVFVWDCANGRVRSILQINAYALAFSPDGRQLAMGVYMPTFTGIQWWDASTGKMVDEARIPEGVQSLWYSPREALLFAIDRDRNVMVWDGAERMRLSWPRLVGVRSLAVSPDESTLAVGGDDGSVRLWDIATRTPRARYRWQLAAIVQLAFSPDGKSLAAATYEGIVYEFAPSGRHVPDSLQAATAAHVAVIASSPDGSTVAVARDSRVVHLYDTQTQQLRAVVHCPVEHAILLAFAPDGRTLATYSAPERVVRLWDTADGRAKGTTGSHASVVNCAAFSSDGQVLATGDNGACHFWDAQSGASIGALAVQGNFTCLAYTLDGRSLLVGNGGALQVWSLDGRAAAKAQRRSTIATQASPLLLAVSPNGQRVATGHPDGVFRLWRLSQDGQLTADGPELTGARRVGMTNLMFGPDSNILLAFRWGEGVLWELLQRRALHRLPPFADRGVLSPDGRALAIMGHDGTFQFCDLPSWRLSQPADQPLWPVYSLAYSADGRTLVVGSGAPDLKVHGDRLGFRTKTAILANTAQTVRLWDVATGLEDKMGLQRKETMDPPYLVACSPDGRAVAAGAVDGSVWLWDWAGGKLLARCFLSDEVRGYAKFSELARRLLPNNYPEYAKQPEAVQALAFSPDGRWLMAAGSRGSVRVWKTSGWAEHWAAQGDPAGVQWAGFTPDSRRVATSRGGQVQFWDVDTGVLERALGAEEDSPVLCGAFAPGGGLLATGSKDRGIRLWDLGTSSVKHQLVSHQDHVTALAFTPDGRTLASGSRDHTVRLWNMKVLQEVAVLEAHQGPVRAVAFSPDGQTLASGGDNPSNGTGQVFLWRAKRP